MTDHKKIYGHPTIALPVILGELRRAGFPDGIVKSAKSKWHDGREVVILAYLSAGPEDAKVVEAIHATLRN